MEQRIFTDKYIRSLAPQDKPYKRSEHAPKGEGRMVVRVLPSGVKEFFYRYRTGRRDVTLALGRYDPTGKSGRTLAQLNQQAIEKRSLQRSSGDVKAHLKEEDRIAEVERRKGTLQQLMDTYTEYLKGAGKPSWAQAQGIFNRNVTKHFPALASSKAADIEPGDIQRVLARMVKAGITRQVNVLRSYLHAAFAHGMKADHDPRTVAKEGVLFGLKSNPVGAVPKIQEFERTLDRTLTDSELKLYWEALDRLPLVQAATLRFNLAIACQRPTQVLRASWENFDFHQGVLNIVDTKGRGSSRDHLIPLPQFALDQLEPIKQLNAPSRSDPVLPFSADGKRAMVLETLSTAVREISDSLVKEHGIKPFRQRDLRRTAETMLQQMRIDKEVRAHLLSHGRTQGVQGKHYERYDFLDEKRQALNKWVRHLARIIDPKQKAKVVPLRSA